MGDHRFRVPSENLVPESDRPFFLPPSQEDGFIFELNPTAPLVEQGSVLVQERGVICDRARGLKAHVNLTICASEEVEWKGRRWLKNGDDTFWTYSPDLPTAANAPFVSCHKMQVEGHSGLCTATLALGDLALTISFDDDELPALEATYERAARMLRSWEM